MSNDQPVRKVTPFKSGRRTSTVRRLDVGFAGTALEQALHDQREEDASMASTQALGHPDTLHASLAPQTPIQDTQTPVQDTQPSIIGTQAKAGDTRALGHLDTQSQFNVDTQTPRMLENASLDEARRSITAYEYNLPSRRGKRRLTPRIDESKVEQLEEIALRCHGSIQDLIEEGVDMLLDKYLGVQPPIYPSVQTPGHPDTQHPGYPRPPINKLTTTELLIFYSSAIGRKVGARDRKIFDEAYKANDPFVLELSMRLAIERAREAGKSGSDIYSFNYCLTPLAEAQMYRPDQRIEKLRELREKQK